MPGAIGVNTGATLSISATLPTTYDDNVTTGYPSATFTDTGEVTNIGEVAKTFQVVAHQAIKRAYPQKFKDIYDIGDMELTIARDWDDAGQVILKTALDSIASYSFEISLPGGETIYFTAKVTKAGFGGATPGDMNMLNVSLAIDPESIFETAA